jgi:hypothetical protein
MKIYIFSEISHQAQDFYERLSRLGFDCEVFSYLGFEEREFSKIKGKKGIFIFICNNFQSRYLQKDLNIPTLIINSNSSSFILVRGVLSKKCNDEDLKRAIKETYALWK